VRAACRPATRRPHDPGGSARPADRGRCRALSAAAHLPAAARHAGFAHAAALMPWGGYVLMPYDIAPAASGERWLIEPMEFMRRALALQPVTPGGPAK